MWVYLDGLKFYCVFEHGEIMQIKERVKVDVFHSFSRHCQKVFCKDNVQDKMVWHRNRDSISPRTQKIMDWAEKVYRLQEYANQLTQ